MNSDAPSSTGRACVGAVAAVGLVLLVVAAAGAQQVSQGQGATVEVRANPQLVTPGEKVTISGFSDIDARVPTVRLAVTRTGGEAVTLALPADSQGNFSTTYDRTRTSGRYEVVAYSPSGRSSAKAYFTVAQPAALVGDIGGEVENDLTQAQSALDQIAQMAATLPTSPPEREFQQRINDLRSRIGGLQERLPVATDAFDKLKNMLQQAPETGDPLQKYVQQLRDWDDRSREERARLPKLTFGNTVCEQLERINEGLNLISLLFDLIGTPLQIVNNVLYDKYATDALASMANVQNGNAQFAISQFLKVGVVAGAREGGKIGRVQGSIRLKETVDLTGTIIGVVGDVTQFLVQKLFGLSCERFIGLFSATLNAEFFTKGMEPWWRYSEDLAGMLDLRYPKDAPPGSPITMTGEFLGVATRFTIWEDVPRFLKLTQGSIAFHVRRPPIGTPFSPAAMKIGKAAFNQFPKAFHVPVTATYYDDRITIHVQEGGSDISEVAKVTYLFITPLTLMIPAITTTDFPYKDAHFVLAHSTDDGIIELPVTSSDGKLFVATSALKRTTGEGSQAHGRYTLTIRVCNPGCP